MLIVVMICDTGGRYVSSAAFGFDRRGHDDYLGRRAARRVAGTPLRCRVMGFVVSVASSNR